MSTRSRSTFLPGTAIREDDFVLAFNAVRAELVSTLYFILHNQEDAQDAAQEAFLKCWRNMEAMSGVQNLKAWIFRVGLNAAKDMQKSAWRRRTKSWTQTTPEAESKGNSPEVELAEKEAVANLQAALAKLGENEQAVFLLRQNGDLTFEEIADMRRVPVGTVKSQMRAALRKLREVLEKEKGDMVGN